MELTLDEVLDAFDNAPDPFTASDLLDVAADYHKDGMISDEEHAKIKKQVEEWEAYHDPF